MELEAIQNALPHKNVIFAVLAVVVPAFITLLFSMYLDHKKEKKLIREGMYNPEFEKGGSWILAAGLLLAFGGAGKAVQTHLTDGQIKYGVVVAFVGVAAIIYWAVRNFYTKDGENKDLKQKMLR